MGDENMEERQLNRPLLEDAEGRSGDLKGRVWEESKKIWRVAFPGILARVSSFGIIVVTQSFIGHVTALDLAAYALVQTLTVRFSNGILLGMSSATETLCGQAFGAGQQHMMGIYLQRSWIVNLITATILFPLFLFTTPIFNLLGEEPDIAERSHLFSFWFIPIMYSYIFSFTTQMFLQAQSKNTVVAWVSAITFVIHILLCWLFVSVLNLGASGAMGALTISNWSVALGMLLYIFGGWCPHSWRGFSRAAFVDLWPVVKLSVSSGLMLCLEFWYNSVLILVAGYASNAEIAISSFSICLNISAWVLMLSLGFLGSACVRVSNELGRGNAKATKFAIKVNVTTSVVIGLIFCILCLIFGKHIAHFFTNTDEIVNTVSSLSVLLAFTILLNSIQVVLSGVAVGAGYQSTVAILNLVCYYGIGIPLGIVLLFVAHFGVKGIWMAMICGMSTQVVALGFVTYKTDWDEQVKKASERLDRWLVKPSEEPDESVNHA